MGNVVSGRGATAGRATRMLVERHCRVWIRKPISIVAPGFREAEMEIGFRSRPDHRTPGSESRPKHWTQIGFRIRPNFAITCGQERGARSSQRRVRNSEYALRRF